MKIGKLMAAMAVGLSMVLGGAALAQQSQGQTQGAQQTVPADSKSEGAGTGATGTTGAATATESSTKWYTGMRADELIGQNVRNEADEEVGKIAKIVVDSDNEAFAVLSVGGFLGIGDKEVAVPLSRMLMGDDKVVLLSTEDEDALKAMPAYDAEAAGYTELKGDQILGK